MTPSFDEIIKLIEQLPAPEQERIRLWLNEKGATYGWDVMTGRTVVPLACSYCDFKAKHCWQNATMEMDSGKPIWVIPS